MRKLEITPAACLVCGSGNVPRNDGMPNSFVDLERDVNWNDPAILCDDCATQVGALVGMVTPDEVRDLERQLRKKDEKIFDLEAKIDQKRREEKVRLRRERGKRAVA